MKEKTNNQNRLLCCGITYDANGNTTNDYFHSFQYDAENRVTWVDYNSQTGAYTAAYSYDPEGLRYAKTAGGVSTSYIFSGSKVIAEYTGGALSKEYIYSGGKLLATLDAAGNPTYHH